MSNALELNGTAIPRLQRKNARVAWDLRGFAFISARGRFLILPRVNVHTLLGDSCTVLVLHCVLLDRN